MSNVTIGAELARSSEEAKIKTEGVASVHIYSESGWTEERLDHDEAMEIVDRRGNVIAVVELDEE